MRAIGAEKTNPVRNLDPLGIGYDLCTDEVDRQHLFAVHVSIDAGQRGLKILLAPVHCLRDYMSQACSPDDSRSGFVRYLRAVLLHVKKDLQIEWRSREAINGALFFALLVIAVFALAFDPTSNPTMAREISGGIAWIGLLFASITALNQSWMREQRNHVLDAHRLSPAPASALFLGKALSNLLFVTAVELVMAPVFVIFYNLHVLGNVWLLLLIAPLATWALVVNGTFFAALGLRARSREILLPLLLLPIALPALLAMVQATTGVLTGNLDNLEIGTWIRMLAGYDIIFTAVCLLLYETVLDAG